MIPLPPTITSMLVRNRSVTDARLTTEIVRNGGEHKNRTTAGARRGRGVEKIRCLADETLQFVAQKVPIDGKALILVRSAALHFRDTDLQRVKKRQPTQSFDPVGDDIGRRGLHIPFGPEISHRLHITLRTTESEVLAG